MRTHKVNSNSRKFTRNFISWTVDGVSRADRCRAIRTPNLEVLPRRKSRRFFTRRGVKKAFDDEPGHPLRTGILNE
jgi:hypothetical protein